MNEIFNYTGPVGVQYAEWSRFGGRMGFVGRKNILRLKWLSMQYKGEFGWLPRVTGSTDPSMNEWEMRRTFIRFEVGIGINL
jgi:hypothetical protein